MFDKSKLDATGASQLEQNRMAIGFYSISLGIWVLLLVRTCRGSKLPFIYLISAIFILYYALYITQLVFYNWYLFGE